MAYQSRRCPYCNIHWPFTTAFLYCRECQAETWPSNQPADEPGGQDMSYTRSRRCSTCGINWPNLDDCRVCPDCQEDTWMCSDPPDRTIPEAKAAIRSKPYTNHPDNTETQELPVVSPSVSAAYAYRLERYLEMGFTEAESHLLASATHRTTVMAKLGGPRAYDVPLSWHQVASALAKGATRAQVVGIYA